MNNPETLQYISFLYILIFIIVIPRLNKAKEFFLGVVALSSASLVAYESFYLTREILSYPLVFGLYSPVFNLFVISWVYYVLFIIDELFRWKKIYALPYLLPLIQWLIGFPYYFMSSEEQVRIITKALNNFSPSSLPDEIGNSFAALSWALVFIIPWFFVFRHFKWKKIFSNFKNNQHFRFAFTLALSLSMGLVIIELLLAYTFSHNRKFAALVLVIGHSIFIVLIIFTYYYPKLHKADEGYFNPHSLSFSQYIRRRLDGSDLNVIKQKLENALNRDKVFINDDISLKKLATLLELTPHQMSEYLNLHLKTKFSDLINTKRVEEAKRIMTKEPEKNIIHVCYDLGYNSISAFNQSFKKITGISPKIWKSMNQNPEHKKRNKNTISKKT